MELKTRILGGDIHFKVVREHTANKDHMGRGLKEWLMKRAEAQTMQELLRKRSLCLRMGKMGQR